MLTSSALPPTTDLPVLRQQLLQLLATKAYAEGDFILSSGQQSSYYINGKFVTLSGEGSFAVGHLLFAQLPEDTDAVAGLTLGADPLVTAVTVVSAYQGCPLSGFIVRKQAKGHGTKAYIEGPEMTVGANVVVLEDVVTTGKSAMEAVNRLRDASYQVKQIIALVDRKQGGAEFYQSQNIDFQSLFTIEDIQEAYRQLSL